MKHRVTLPLIIACLLATFVTQASAKLRKDISITRYADGRKAAVSYTFDDGLEEHYTKVFPVLKQLGLKATFCVIGSKVGGNQKGTPCMTWKQLKEMAEDGQEISNHGWGHKAVIHLTGESLRHEVQQNDTAIFRVTGIFPRTYFYPGNRKTEEALAFCAKDRVGTRTEQVSIGSKRDTTWLKNWVNDLIRQGKWGVGMTHGITIGYDHFQNPETLWKHLEYVSHLQDQLWVATFHDVAAYCRERDAITLKIKEHKGYTSVMPELALDRHIFNVPLTLQVATTELHKASQDGKPLTLHQKDGQTYIQFAPQGGEIRLYGKQK